ncbi:MAG: division/cell wall cluster transcriptional repressor MraZ [Minisyncoccia bacterium]
MLIGEYTHTIDDKKRLALPKKIAKELGKKIVITRGLDGALFMYSAKSWDVIAKKLQQLSFTGADTRGFNRFMLSGASEIDVDGVGRILIPEYLKTFAGLGTKVVLAGVVDRVEVWDAEKWATYKTKIESQADAMAEKLSEVGIL